MGTTKGFGLTALMKIWHKYQSVNIDKDSKIMDILEQFRDDKQIEVQQRSVEFVSLFGCTDGDARKKILKAMPVPKIERLFDERTKAEKKDDPQSNEEDTDTDTETSSDSDPSDSEPSSESPSGSESSQSEKSSSHESLESDSDDSKDTRRKKRKLRKKREKEKAKMAKEKEKERQKKKAERKKKKKNKPEVEVNVPRIMGPDPDDVEQHNGGGVDAFDTPTKSNGGAHGNPMANGGQQRQQPPVPADLGIVNLLDIGPTTSQPAVPQTHPNNGGGGMDFLGDLMSSGPSKSNDVSHVLGINSGGSSMAASPQSSSPSGKAQPFEAYKNNGITATFNFQPNQGHGV